MGDVLKIGAPQTLQTAKQYERLLLREQPGGRGFRDPMPKVSVFPTGNVIWISFWPDSQTQKTLRPATRPSSQGLHCDLRGRRKSPGELLRRYIQCLGKLQE